MSRNKHYGGGPSSHDRSHAPSKWDAPRPMGAPPPKITGGSKKGGVCGLIVLGALGTAALGVAKAASVIAGWAQ